MRLWVKDGCWLKTWCVSVHFDHCTAYRSCNDHVFIVRWFIFIREDCCWQLLWHSQNLQSTSWWWRLQTWASVAGTEFGNAYFTVSLWKVCCVSFCKVIICLSNNSFFLFIFKNSHLEICHLWHRMTNYSNHEIIHVPCRLIGVSLLKCDIIEINVLGLSHKLHL